jgi:hypothetical protein
MPGRSEFLQEVGGDGGGAVSTNATGVLETNNYTEGDSFSFDGSAYPYLLNPPETIQELVVVKSAAIVIQIETKSGTTFDLDLSGSSGVFNHWAINSLEFKDPNGTTAAISGGWAGE